ncbi:MAG: sugar phosphate isomerase/epimerase family protein [Anaerovoracaceae bacterium]
MSIKFSCLPLSIYDEFYSGRYSIEEWASDACDFGYDAVDINEYFMKDMTYEELRKLRDKLRVPVQTVCAYPDFTVPDDKRREQILQDAYITIEKAGAIGAKCVRLTAGQYYPGEDEESTIDHVYECFKKCIEYGKIVGVEMMMENHLKALSFDNVDFVFDDRRLEALWEKIKDLEIGINYDVMNAFLLKDWRKALDMFTGRIKAVHLNDLESEEPFKCCLIGEGKVCIDEMVDILIERGFDGYVSVEECSGNGLLGIKEALPIAEAYFKR